jgi:hypothetical protein
MGIYSYTTLSFYPNGINDLEKDKNGSNKPTDQERGLITSHGGSREALVLPP